MFAELLAPSALARRIFQTVESDNVENVIASARRRGVNATEQEARDFINQNQRRGGAANRRRGR